MRYIYFLFIILVLLGVTVVAEAHERQVIRIGNQDYLFTVGSLNEPIYVDDKTGVDLRVKLADPVKPEDGSSARAKPIEGLENSLKVELKAGNITKVLSLEPAYKDPGAYKAIFFPTVATTLSYRFFGTINSTPVDITFTCNQAEHGQVTESRESVKLGEGVTRIFKTGSFGCPRIKADAGFPEPSTSVEELKDEDGPVLPMLFSGLALLVALLAYKHSRRS